MSKQEVLSGEYELDDVTLKKVAMLIAFGVSERQVADALLLTEEQVVRAQETELYKQELAKKVLERTERQLDLADGWDAIEEMALKNVYETLQHNRDPRYSLLAAKTANGARRRQNDNVANKTIDAGKAGNVIVLSLSKTFVEKRQVTTEKATLEIAQQIDGPKKISDTVTPGVVTKLLGAPSRKDESELAKAIGNIFDELGIAESMMEKGK